VSDLVDEALPITPKGWGGGGDYNGVKSGDLGGQAIGTPLPIHPTGSI